MAVGGIGSFSTLTSYSGVNSSKANSELEFDKIYQQKTDSVEINSTAGNNDIVTIYEMLCSEFPEANYILEDRSDDVSVIKKIQEDPSYYLEAKLDLQQIIEHYDEARTHGGSDLPYTTGELDYENGRIQAGWRYDSKCCQEAVAKEVKKLESLKLSDTINYDYIKDKMDTMLDDFMDKVTEGIVGNDKEGK